MHFNLPPLISFLFVLITCTAFAQVENHPEAEKVMAKIVLQKDYGNHLKFDSREVVTVARNDRVPGLNGLMFMYWRGDAGVKITAEVLWFEKKDELLKFYASTIKGKNYKLGEFNGAAIWKFGENGCTWTDGEHFLASLNGDLPPPGEMVKDWLALIGNKVAETAKEAGKSPAEEPKK